MSLPPRRENPGPATSCVAGGTGRRLLFTLAFVVLLTASAPLAGATLRAPLEPGLVAALSDTGELYVQALPRRGEAMIQLARRVCGTTAAVDAIARANRGSRRLLAGVRYRIPFEILRGDLQVQVARELFVADRAETGGWRHVTADLGKGRSPTLESIAVWFTGRIESARTLRTVNGLGPGQVPPRTEILVPAELLLPPFRSLLPVARPPAPQRVATPAPRAPANPAPSPSPAPTRGAALPPPPVPASPASEPPGGGAASRPVAAAGVEQVPPPEATATPVPPPPPVVPAVSVAAPVAEGASTFPLDYGRDDKGAYAVYHLRPGEALYSAVVVRFTGQLQAEDVIALAREIADRSGIPDVTDIAIGFPVKIPRDMLLPEFLPPDDPKRLEYEAQLSETAKYRNQVKSAGLEGITVVLDAGHGGADVGASVDGTWESLYVYDIAQRIRQVLESRTLAQVHLTTRDGDLSSVIDKDVLPASRSHVVLTTPPYRIADSKVGVHLRWYLANSLFRKALGTGRRSSETAEVERVIFVSVHADSLHPSLRGATVYIPSAERTAGSFRKEGPIFESRLEVREAQTVEFSRKERVRSEGLSRQLGNRLIESFRGAGLAVHPYKPVRDAIIRNRRVWVPAVLRYNAVPAKVLLEVCNLANPEDRKLLRTRAFREQVAEAAVAAVLAYYGKAPSPLAPTAAAR